MEQNAGIAPFALFSLIALVTLGPLRTSRSRNAGGTRDSNGASRTGGARGTCRADRPGFTDRASDSCGPGRTLGTWRARDARRTRWTRRSLRALRSCGTRLGLATGE